MNYNEYDLSKINFLDFREMETVSAKSTKFLQPVFLNRVVQWAGEIVREYYLQFELEILFGCSDIDIISSAYRCTVGYFLPHNKVNY